MGCSSRLFWGDMFCMYRVVLSIACVLVWFVSPARSIAKP